MDDHSSVNYETFRRGFGTISLYFYFLTASKSRVLFVEGILLLFLSSWFIYIFCRRRRDAIFFSVDFVWQIILNKKIFEVSLSFRFWLSRRTKGGKLTCKYKVLMFYQSDKHRLSFFFYIQQIRLIFKQTLQGIPSNKSQRHLQSERYEINKNTLP